MSSIVRLWDFLNAQGQQTSQSMVGSGRISNSSEVLWLSMFVICKNQEHPIENEGARVFTTLYLNFSDANSVVNGGISQKFKLIQAFVHVLITCKNEDPIKNEGARVATAYLPL